MVIFTAIEPFVPSPPERIIELDIELLKAAVEVAKIELLTFSARLKQINVDEALKIENIDKLLVWG